MTDFTALVTGSSRGIGEAIALRLGEEGAAVAVNYLTSDQEGKKTVEGVEKAGGKGAAFQADVSDEAQCEELVDAVEDRFGPIDLLVNNADGNVFEPKQPLNFSPSEWKRRFLTPFQCVLTPTMTVAPKMENRGGGTIVNIAATGWSRSDIATVCLPYYLSKASVVWFTRHVAAELAGRGVDLFSVSPGFVSNYEYGDELRDIALNAIPSGEMTTPEAVADAVVGLAYGGAEGTTGTNIHVAGGLTD